jgi:hypothetical protein
MMFVVHHRGDGGSHCQDVPGSNLLEGLEHISLWEGLIFELGGYCFGV